jgi:hypothetical protein
VGIYRDLNKVPEKFKANPAFEARQGDIATVRHGVLVDTAVANELGD